MARPRRKAREDRLTADQWDELCTGESGFTEASAFESEAERRGRWQRHREDLLRWWTRGPDAPDPPADRFWARTPGEPGTRPWAWWEYDAPERRRLTDPDRLREHVAARRNTPEDTPDRAVETARNWTGESRFGIPRRDEDGNVYRWGYVGFESEREYLERLDLLMPWEAMGGGA